MMTYTVTNTDASGPGSLAAALAQAHSGDTIQFAIGGTITLSGTTALPAGSVIFDTTDAAGTAHDVTVGGGALADAAGAKSGLAKTGAGTLTLTNTANTYSGGTTLSGGTLDATPASSSASTSTALGTGTIVFDGGKLNLDGVKLGNTATIDARGGEISLDSGTYSFGIGELDGDIGTSPGTTAGAFTVDAPPNDNNTFDTGVGLFLTGTDTFAGGLVIDNVAVNVGNGGSAGLLTGNVTGSGYGVLAFNHSAGTTTTFAGNISGEVAFNQVAGITVLTGTNTYSRATAFQTGTLRAGSAGAFSPSSQMVADSSDAEEVATIDLAGFNETIGGLLASHPYGPNERDVVTNSGGAPVTLTIAAGGPSTPYATQQNQNYGGYGRYFDGVIQDGDPALGGGTLAIDVAGNLNLAQPSTYSGGTVIEAGGTLTFLSQSADGTDKGIKIGGNAFGGVRGAIVDNGTLGLVALAYGGPATPQAVANAISGSGGVTMTVDPYNAARDGIVVLTGHNTYTGATLVDHGTLQGGVADAFGTNSAVTVNGNTFGHGATLDLGGNPQAIGSLSGDSGGVVTDSGAAAVLTVGGGDGSGTFLGTIRDGAGAVALVKAGAGTEALAGADSYTGGTTIAAGTLEFASDAALPPGTIAFAGSAATLKLDAAPANGATFADPLSGLAPGDALDLAGLAFTAGATATVSGDRLAVTSGGTTEYFTLAGATTSAFAVTQDAAGGTLVTGIVPTKAPIPPPPADSITVDQNVAYNGDGTFTLTGTVFSTVGVRGVEFTTDIDGQPDQHLDLGAAALNSDGTFSFTDAVGGRLQGFITATETDNAGLQTQAAFRPALQGGRSPHADRYTVTPTDVTYTGSTYYRADGSHRVTVTASDQTVGSAYKDTFLNDGVPNTTFVFEPGYGHDVVSLFRVDNTDHDTLSFKGSDFGTDPASQLAAVLAHSRFEKGGVVITDPTTQEAVKLLGISKQQLVQNQQDFTFHA